MFPNGYCPSHFYSNGQCFDVGIQILLSHTSSSTVYISTNKLPNKGRSTVAL